MNNLAWNRENSKASRTSCAVCDGPDQYIGHIVRRFTPPYFEAFDAGGQSIGTFETQADAVLALATVVR